MAAIVPAANVDKAQPQFDTPINNSQIEEEKAPPAKPRKSIKVEEQHLLAKEIVSGEASESKSRKSSRKKMEVERKMSVDEYELKSISQSELKNDSSKSISNSSKSLKMEESKVEESKNSMEPPLKM